MTEKWEWKNLKKPGVVLYIARLFVYVIIAKKIFIADYDPMWRITHFLLLLLLIEVWSK